MCGGSSRRQAVLVAMWKKLRVKLAFFSQVGLDETGRTGRCPTSETEPRGVTQIYIHFRTIGVSAVNVLLVSPELRLEVADSTLPHISPLRSEALVSDGLFSKWIGDLSRQLNETHHSTSVTLLGQIC